MKPLVSTITPCFRMKPYLKRFLDELPLQTYFDRLEIVLDHNEPDEEELQWIREFQERYPGRLKHIVVHPVDPIGVSMNRCIKEASGDLLTIWNVDDLRTPDSIERQVAAFEEGADIVYGNFIVVRSFGATSGTITDFTTYKGRHEEFTRSMVLGPFMAFRKSLCEKAGMFDEQLKSGADFDLAVRLAFHGRSGMADGILGYYLNEGKGASTRPGSKQVVERTVIELRYGIYDKLDYDAVVSALSYDLSHVVKDGDAVPVSVYVPEYSQMLQERYTTLHTKGLRKYALRKAFYADHLERMAKGYIKKFLMKPR